MAVVYKAADQLLGRPVAIKVLRPQYSSDPGFLARFRREAQAAAMLSHPNIVAIFDVGQDQGWHYLVMEYVQGPTLQEILSTERVLDVARSLNLAVQTAQALGYAHQAGLVHRDVKPGNILVTANDKVKVTDFGIARSLAQATVTEPGVVMGTTHYLAPEVINGQPATPASDVYAMGVVLYRMLTGRLPFQAETSMAIMLKHLQEPPTPPRSLNPLIPAALERIVLVCLSKDPLTRYANGNVLADALGDLLDLSQEPTSVRPAVPAGKPAVSTTPAAPAAPRTTSFDWLALILGILAIAAIVGLIPLWYSVYQRYSRPVPAAAAQMIQVPSLMGLDQVEAAYKLSAAGLKLALVGTRPDNQVPALHIVEQNPAPQTPVPPDTVVSVTLSGGAAFTKVPQVAGRPANDAIQELKSAGFNPEPHNQWSSSVPAGQVIQQQPAGGEAAPAGAGISLAVSTGQTIPSGAQLAETIELVNVTLPRDHFRPGESLELQLTWKALKRPNLSYKVFVHLAREDGTPVVQKDTMPANNQLPTVNWNTGTIVQDPYALPLPANLSPGQYWIRVGMYQSNNNQRLPITQPGELAVKDNSIIVHPVTIAP